eukprot:gene5406-6081_t
MYIVEVLKSVGEENLWTEHAYTITELALSILVVISNSMQAVSLYRNNNNSNNQQLQSACCHDEMIHSLTLLCILTGLSNTAIAIVRVTMADVMDRHQETVIVFFLYLSLFFEIISLTMHAIIIDIELLKFRNGNPFAHAQCLHTKKSARYVICACVWVAPGVLVLASQFHPPLATELATGFSITLALLSAWLLKNLSCCRQVKTMVFVKATSHTRTTSQQQQQQQQQHQQMLSASILSICTLAMLISAVMCIGKSFCSALAMRLSILINSLMNPIVYFALNCIIRYYNAQPAQPVVRYNRANVQLQVEMQTNVDNP